jgi:hypothetical protein
MNIKRVKYKDIEQIPKLKVNKNFKQSFQGSAPTPFIGCFGYPKVNIGVLSPQFSGDMENYSSPRLWATNNTQIGEIATNRYSLVNSRTLHSIKDLKGKFLETVQEVGMAKKSSEVEIMLKKIPQLTIKSEREVTPWGPASQMQKARITSNTSVDKRVEYVVRDNDLKAAPAITKLYKKGFEEAALSKLISVGNLGLKNNRKLVPTRWSITATDDTIGKFLIKEIKDFQEGDFQAYFGGGWGNYYLHLFFPEVWSYELFESYIHKKVNPWSKQGFSYSTDYENYGGRKNYAEETAGGYYAARIAILEKMKSNKRQNSCLTLRFILPDYNIPLGVWVVREASRKSCQAIPLRFATEKLMLQYAKKLVKSKFDIDIDLFLNQSKLMKEKKLQTRLTQY